jgi:hypothetical protein
MNGCRFENCVFIATITAMFADIKITDSLFERCRGILIEGVWLRSQVEIKNCKFISCKNALFSLRAAANCSTISKCEFINYRAGTKKVASVACTPSEKGIVTMNFTKCVFDGVYLAARGSLLKVNVNGHNQGGAFFYDCEFRHCKTEDGGALMDTTDTISGGLSPSTVDTVRFQNCTGIDYDAILDVQDKTGAIPEDQIVRLNEDGEPYGANEAELANCGVPGTE